MLKRALAGILGALSAVTGAILFYSTAKSLPDQASPLYLALVESFIGFGMGIAAIILGVRYLRFACSGTLALNEFAKIFLLGIGWFFPALLLSLPFTLYWANRTWPGDGQSSLAAMAVSLCIGVIASIFCWFVLLLRRSGRNSRTALNGKT